MNATKRMTRGNGFGDPNGHGDPNDPMRQPSITVPQTKFIQNLLAERQGNEEAENFRLIANALFRSRSFTKRAASDMITALLAIPANAKTTAPVQPNVDPIPSDLVAGRIYINSKAEIVRVSKSKAGRLYGKVRIPGGWEYAPGSLGGARALTAEEAAEFGHRNDRCVFCYLRLSDEGADRSVQVGYGPVCAKKYGLPWG